MEIYFMFLVRKMSFLWSVNDSDLPPKEVSSSKDEKSKITEDQNTKKRKIPLEIDVESASKMAKESLVKENGDKKSNLKRALEKTPDTASASPNVKKSKNNEISSSLSSSSNSSQILEISSNSKSQEIPEEDSEKPSISSRKRKALVFPKDLSPKKMLKDLSVSTPEKVNSRKNSEKDVPEDNVEIISDLKAYNADQEKSMERGKELLKAFEDD